MPGRLRPICQSPIRPAPGDPRGDQPPSERPATLTGRRPDVPEAEGQRRLSRVGGLDEGQPGLGLTELPAWTVWQGNVDVIPGSSSNSLGVWHQAADGANSLELMGTPGVGGIAQAVPTVTGKKYQLSGWIAHHPGISQAGVWVWIADQWVPTPLYHSGQASQSNMNWQRFNIEFIAKSDSTVIGFIDRNLDSYEYGGAMLDGLSVTPIATTASLSEPTLRSKSSSGESAKREVTSADLLKMMLAHPSVKGDLQKQAAIRKQFQERESGKVPVQQVSASIISPTPLPSKVSQAVTEK